MNWRIEMVSSRHGKAFEWTVTKGVNLHSDGPEATVCKVTSSAEDAALIAAAPEMYRELRAVLATQRSRYGNGMGLHLDMITAAERIEKILAKARGEK